MRPDGTPRASRPRTPAPGGAASRTLPPGALPPGSVVSATTTARRRRPAVPPSQHDRRRRVRPVRAPRRRWRLGGPSRRSLLVGAAGAVALVVLLGWLVWFSPVLAVRTVTVAGAGGNAGVVVRDLAGVPEGLPLARVDTAGIEQLLAALPQLESASVHRVWPSTVRIEVVQRVGLAVVDVDGVQWLIDHTGVLFAQVTQPPAGTPALQVQAAGPEDRATQAALDVIGALPADIVGQVATVAAQSPDSVVLTLTGGRTVIWGSAADSERKALVLAGVFARPGHTIDVSSPDAVVLR